MTVYEEDGYTGIDYIHMRDVAHSNVTVRGHEYKSNTLQNPATLLQHTAAQCNTLQHIATHCNTYRDSREHEYISNTLQHTATHCNTYHDSS